jgi:hypothetical protein
MRNLGLPRIFVPLRRSEAAATLARVENAHDSHGERRAVGRLPMSKVGREQDEWDSHDQSIFPTNACVFYLDVRIASGTDRHQHVVSVGNLGLLRQRFSEPHAPKVKDSRRPH